VSPAFPLFFNVDCYTRIEPLPQFVGPDDTVRAGVFAGQTDLAGSHQ
jgi:hypothetical protein